MRTALLDQMRCPWSGTTFALDTVDGDDADVELGVLRSEAGEFPVVAGIPVLRRGEVDLLARVRAGDHDRALLRACIGEIPPEGHHRLGPWLASTHRLGAAGRRMEARWQDDLTRRAQPLLDPATGPRELFDLAYHRLHLRNPEVYAYNWYRFGVPRHLAALACLEWAPPTGPVLDLGCGAGHLTWAVARHVAPDPVVGVDGMFFALHVARSRLAPAADYVCAELDSLPFASGSFRGVWASDVFEALARKAAVSRELARVRHDPSWLAVISLTVAGHDHTYAGRPLSIEGYLGLLPEGTTVDGDADLLAAYLEGHALRSGTSVDLAAAARVTARWAAPGLEVNEGAAFPDWPHGRGERGINPLLVPAEAVDGGRRFHRNLPSPDFARSHPGLVDYLPEEVVVPDPLTPEAQDDLVGQFVVLGLPPGYLDDPWPGVHVAG